MIVHEHINRKRKRENDFFPEAGNVDCRKNNDRSTKNDKTRRTTVRQQEESQENSPEEFWNNSRGQLNNCALFFIVLDKK